MKGVRSGVERRRGWVLKARDPGRRKTPGKVLKERRSPRHPRSYGDQFDVERALLGSRRSATTFIPNAFARTAHALPDVPVPDDRHRLPLEHPDRVAHPLPFRLRRAHRVNLLREPQRREQRPLPERRGEGASGVRQRRDGVAHARDREDVLHARAAGVEPRHAAVSLGGSMGGPVSSRRRRRGRRRRRARRGEYLAHHLRVPEGVELKGVTWS